jgi:hypothetical protein
VKPLAWEGVLYSTHSHNSVVGRKRERAALKFLLLMF